MIKSQTGKLLLWPVISITGFLLLWQLFSSLNLLNENLLPGPLVVLRKIFRGIVSGPLLNDIFNSLRRVILGFFLGSILGIAIGLICSLRKLAGNFLRPVIEFIRPIPPIAWIPLSILWFGFGEPSAYFLVSLGAFFPAFNGTYLGISQVSPGTVEVAKCHGVDRSFLFWKIILPQSLPSIFSGLRIGLGVSWMIVITAELVGVQNGLGYFIQVSRAQLQTEQVIAGMVIIGAVGLLLSLTLSVIAKLAMPWKRRELKIGADD